MAVSSSETPDWLEATFAALMTIVAGVGWLAVLLASMGQFSLPTLSLLTLAVTGVAWWAQRPFSLPRFSPPTRYEILLLLGLAAFAILYFRPHEYILGGTDAGTYTNIAATLAKTGKFVLHDDWTAFLRQHADVTLREQPAHWQTRYLQFVGWYIDDHDPSRVIPQFFLFHPVWLAIGISLGGLYGGLLTTPLWGVLGLLAVYLLARRLFDRPIALLTAVLLGLTPTHIYFARYPTTEPLTLLLVFTGLLALQRLWDDRQAPLAWGMLGGLALGSALLTRIDLPLVVMLIMAALFIRWRQRRWSPAFTTFTLVSGFFLVHAILSALLINWPYTWNTYGSIIRLLTRSTFVLTAVGMLMAGVLGGLLAWRKGWITTVEAQKFIHSPTVRRICALLLILVSAYAYFIRPVWEPVLVSYNSWPGGQEIPFVDGQNWLRMGWYLTPLGVLLATLGAAWVVAEKPWARYGLFLSLGLLTTVQYVYRIFNTPYHIYAMRRYVPIVIPMLMIYTAVALVVIFRARPERLMRIVGAALAVGLGAGLIYQARFVMSQRDYVGAVAQLTALNAALDPAAIVIINDPPESNLADQLGVPLRFLFGHDIATIRGEGEAIRPFLQELVRYAAAAERPLQLLAINPVDPVISQELALQPATVIPLTVAMLANTFYEFPTAVRPIYYGVEIYNATEFAPNLTSATQRVDIGHLDAIYVVDGFYHKEVRPESPTARWTDETATLSLSLSYSTPVTITLRAMIYRPEAVAATPVHVVLDNQEIGQFIPDNTWQTYTFSGRSAPKNNLSMLQFVAKTFNPNSLQLSADSRDLGFLLDWVEITPSPK
jgi:4-amino-4-deoxy-L-arabinose transferase-like glycosyltransferase